MSASNEDSPKTQIIELRNEVAELKERNTELERRNEANTFGYHKDLTALVATVKVLTKNSNNAVKAIAGSVD